MRCLSRRDAAPPTAQERRCKCEFRRYGTALRQALRPSNNGLPNGVHEIRSAQLALGAETGHDDGLWSWQLPGIVGIGGDVHKYLIGPWNIGIKTTLKRCVHRATNRPVHNRFCASEARRAVMADQQWLRDVGEIAVHDGDAQGRSWGYHPLHRRRRRGRQHVDFALWWRFTDRQSRRTASHEWPGGRSGASPRSLSGGQRREPIRLAFAQQVSISLKGFLVPGQRSMIGVHDPGGHPRQHRALQHDSAVTLIRRIQINHAFVGFLVTRGCVFRLADYEQKFVCE